MQPETPQQTPQQVPAQPLQTVPQTPLQATTPPPATAQLPKNKKVGLIIGIVVGILVLAGGAIAAYFLFFSPPSKEDFKQTILLNNSLEETSDEVEKRLGAVAVAKTDEAADKAVADVKEIFGEYRSKLNELSGHKSLRDQEVGEAGRAYIKQARQAADVSEPFAEDLGKMAAAANICSPQAFLETSEKPASPEALVQELTKLKAKFEQCVQDSKNLKDLKSEPGKQLAEIRQKGYENVVKVLDEMIAAANAADGTAYNAAGKKLSAVQREAHNQTKEVFESLQEQAGDKAAAKAFNKFQELLEKKAN